MSVWFEGTSEVACAFEDVKRSLSNPGEYYLDVVRLLPGLTSVELVGQPEDAVTIRTNEGLMRRSNLTKSIEEDRVVVECDEVYEAGSRVTVTSHFRDEFIKDNTGITHRLVISDVEAGGLGGFLYRRLGSSKMGEAFLAATKAHLES